MDVRDNGREEGRGKREEGRCKGEEKGLGSDNREDRIRDRERKVQNERKSDFAISRETRNENPWREDSCKPCKSSILSPQSSVLQFSVFSPLDGLGGLISLFGFH
jgi:hypothetical protein